MYSEHPNEVSCGVFHGVPEATQKFSLEQLPLYDELLGDIEFSSQWIPIQACGNEYYISNNVCDACTNNRDPDQKCESCVQGFVMTEDSMCVEKNDPHNSSNTIIIVLCISIPVLAIILAISIWLCLIMKRRYKKFDQESTCLYNDETDDCAE